MNINKLLNSNLSEAKNYIEELISNYEYYNYIIDKQKCLDIITKNVIDYLANTNIEKVKTKYLNNQIKEQVNNFLNHEITKPQNTIRILNNYLNINLKGSNDYYKKIKFFSNLNKFISDINYIITPEVINELITKNKILYNLIEYIFNKNIEMIKKGEIYDILPNETIISFAEVYAGINNIDIENTENIAEELEKNYKKIVIQ